MCVEMDAYTGSGYLLLPKERLYMLLVHQGINVAKTRPLHVESAQ